MLVNRFGKILKHIWLRRSKETWQKIIYNCKNNYEPSPFICINEQLIHFMEDVLFDTTNQQNQGKKV